MSIIVSHLCKMYGTQKAVNDITFSINKGEIVGFLGPNGAGKSTTMKMITGYLKADAGSIEVSGDKLSGNSLSVKKKIGYLPESNPLYFDMYVREYLQFISAVHKIKNPKQAIASVIEITGLTIEANKKIGELSKGYKQRVGLAAALIHDPEVLILDEPTSGLDPNQLAEIREVIKNLGQNKTVLFSSHILQEVQAICDRVIIINKGIIVADDRLSNLQKVSNNLSVVLVAFKEMVAPELFKTISSITLVEQIQKQGWPEASSGSNFKLQTTQPDSVRKQLLELCLDNNLNIVSLHSESNSLEDIFRNLTSMEHNN
ncbi:MAG: gliding motility-associated ABC transporter ATP-binding subunit GldA [Ferruginibacter sp.]|nr:gliding motility-associated ABC transporter ATP-binding subunit GldA [Ferruginibacter sp.]